MLAFHLIFLFASSACQSMKRNAAVMSSVIGCGEKGSSIQEAVQGIGDAAGGVTARHDLDIHTDKSHLSNE